MNKADSAPFEDPQDIFNWLSRYINFEKGLKGRNFRLDRMQALAELAGNPQNASIAIHAAGSKGKGSVTAMTAALLEGAGFKTGRYSSPHVHDYRERISLSNGYFPDSVYIQAGEELRKLAEKALKEKAALFDPQHANGEEATFFELLTLLFFLCARSASCTAMAVETGMGGRLDATNILKPAVTIITPIELEHTEYLGSTLAAIAGEKAGIIKQNTALVLAEQENEALSVFRRFASEKQAPLFYVPEQVNITKTSINRNGSSARLEFVDKKLFESPLDIEIPLVGSIQLRNAAAAIIAFRLAVPDAKTSLFQESLSTVRLPGRFERVLDNPPLVIDGAHTPKSVQLSSDTFCSLYGTGGLALFACAEDKSPDKMAAILTASFSHIVITSTGSFKKSRPDQVYECFKEAAGSACAVELYPEPAEAFRHIRETAIKNGLPTLVCGSFYLAAEIYPLL